MLPARGAVDEGQGSRQLGHSLAEDAAGAAHCRLAAARHRLPDGLRDVCATGPDHAYDRPLRRVPTSSCGRMS